MARLYFKEIDDETENEETEDIEAAENSAYRKMEATEKIGRASCRERVLAIV